MLVYEIVIFDSNAIVYIESPISSNIKDAVLLSGISGWNYKSLFNLLNGFHFILQWQDSDTFYISRNILVESLDNYDYAKTSHCIRVSTPDKKRYAIVGIVDISIGCQ